MNTISDWLTSKTVWAGIGLVGLGIYQLTLGQLQAALQSFLAAGVALGLRHAIAKSAMPFR